MKKFMLMFVIMLSMFASAQLNVLNVPSPDLAGKGHIYGRLDAFVNPHTTNQTAYNFGSQPFGLLTPNLVYGLTDRLDIGVNTYALTINTGTQASLVPNFKYKLIDPKGEGIGVIVGDQVYAPLGHQLLGGGNMFYSAAYLDVEGFGFLTVGAYNGQNLFANGNRTGALVAYEHTFSERFTGSADWMSGKNAQSTVGLKFYPRAFSHRLMITPGWAFYNTGARRNGLSLSIGYDFGKLR